MRNVVGKIIVMGALADRVLLILEVILATLWLIYTFIIRCTGLSQKGFTFS